jgi:hypothetical protein
MGTLTYNTTTRVDFDDRLLAHLRLVIGMKLRRGESFYLNWKDDASIGDGSSTIWLNPAIPLSFKFNGGRDVSINQRWLEDLVTSANSASGLRPVPEPTASSREEGS